MRRRNRHNCRDGTPPAATLRAVKAVILAEDALAPGARLWSDAVDHLARKLGRVTPLDTAAISDDRCQALAQLETWAGADASSWKIELARFYEEHIPVYVRPDPALNAVVRQLLNSGTRVAAWSPGPPQVGAIVTHFLGLSRRLELERVEPSHHGPVALIEELGLEPADALVVSASPHVIAEAKHAGAATAAALWTGGSREQLLAVLPSYLAETPDELLKLAAA
jgi:phosphoglycolate phosphatase-like HAD superfamily hydrolase